MSKVRGIWSSDKTPPKECLDRGVDSDISLTTTAQNSNINFWLQIFLFGFFCLDFFQIFLSVSEGRFRYLFHHHRKEFKHTFFTSDFESKIFMPQNVPVHCSVKKWTNIRCHHRREFKHTFLTSDFFTDIQNPNTGFQLEKWDRERKRERKKNPWIEFALSLSSQVGCKEVLDKIRFWTS